MDFQEFFTFKVHTLLSYSTIKCSQNFAYVTYKNYDTKRPKIQSTLAPKYDTL